MAFTNTGVFTPDTTQPVTGIEQLLVDQRKKKKGTATAVVTQPANAFASATTAAPTIAGITASESGGSVSTPGFSDPGHDTAETAEEKAAREAAEAAATQGGGGGKKNGMPEAPATWTPEIRYISNDPASPYYWETLGYEDESWAGLPLEMGFWQEEEDGTKTWVQQKDMRNTAQQLHDMQNIPMPESPTLQDITDSDPYASAQGILDIINDPATSAADRAAAIAQFEQEMGQQPGWYADQMAGMYGGLSTGVMGQQGLNDEYVRDYNRETQLELQSMRNDYTQMIEAMSAQGRNVAGYQKMDEVVNSMASFDAKRRMERVNLDMATKQAEYDALNQRWQELFNMGQMTAQQYMDNQYKNRTLALQGYAQQISAIIAENNLTLDQYRADLQAVQVHSETVYKGIMADMGVSEAMMTQMQGYYEMHLAPYYAELERWSLEQEQKARQQETTMTAIGIGLGIILAPLATSAICIEMMRQGFFPEEWRDIDMQFGRIVRSRRPDVHSGYKRFCDWAIPIMRRSKVFTFFVNIFFQPWVRDMAYLMGRTKKKCHFGRFLNKFGFWLFARTGRE